MTEQNPEIVFAPDSEDDARVILDPKKKYIRYDLYKLADIRCGILSDAMDKLHNIYKDDDEHRADGIITEARAEIEREILNYKRKIENIYN